MIVMWISIPITRASLSANPTGKLVSDYYRKCNTKRLGIRASSSSAAPGIDLNSLDSAIAKVLHIFCAVYLFIYIQFIKIKLIIIIYIQFI